MSLKPTPIPPVPEATAYVARAVFPRGKVLMQLRDTLGTVYSDDQFADLFPAHGHPAVAPWRLALVPVVQVMEHVTDRQAADAVRRCLDGKYLLSLELTDGGFDHTVLSEFRTRLLQGSAELRLLERFLTRCRAALARVSAEIEQRLTAKWEAIALLDTIPGVSQRTAEGVIAEIGSDLSRFKSAGHLASWAGMCPGNAQSGGKQLSGRTRKGNAWLRRTLVEIAHVAAKTKDTSLAAHYRRIATRRGKKRALIAVGHSVLVMIYHILTKRVPYQELGGTYFDERERDQVQRRLVHRLERLGYAVTLATTSQPTL